MLQNKKTGKIHCNTSVLAQYIQNIAISTCNQSNKTLLIRFFTFLFLTLKNPVGILHLQHFSVGTLSFQ